MAEQSSIGAYFQYSTDNVTYTTIGSILDLDYPGAEKDIKEGTYLNQANRWKTFFGAFVDPGEVTLKIKFSKSMVATQLAAIDDQEPIYWRIVVPDGTNIADPSTCSTWVNLGLLKTGPGLTFPSDGDKVAIPLVVKFSGIPTWTPAP